MAIGEGFASVVLSNRIVLGFHGSGEGRNVFFIPFQFPKEHSELVAYHGVGLRPSGSSNSYSLCSPVWVAGFGGAKMEKTGGCGNNSMLWFFKDKGFDDKVINDMFKKCKRLEGVKSETASENWAYLKSIGIQERKIPYVVSRCPKILTLGLNEKLVPMVGCLETLGSKPGEVATAITKFPHILSHSVEEKLCPLLAYFQASGVPEKQLGKIILLNPRLVSYSIEPKLMQVVEFLASLGLTKDGMIGKVLVKYPYILGYNVDKRLRPTTGFLKSLGLSDSDLQRVVMNFPEILCRDVSKILTPNVDYLRSRGFDVRQVAALVTGYPPVLIKSVKNSLEPRIRFLVEVMERQIDEVADYPVFFKHGLKKRLESRQKILKKRNVSCSLNEMLECNQQKFLTKFGLVENLA